MFSISTTLSNAVNGYCQRGSHRDPDYCGLMRRKNPALRAFIGAWLLSQNAFGIDSITRASVIADVSRPMLRAAKALLEPQDAARVERVLSNGESLLRVAAELRDHARVVESFKPTVPIIRVIPALFDSAIASAL